MSIELNLSAGTLQALALFTSAKAGKQDTNPNTAVHFRYIDDFGLRVAATNGRQSAFLRITKDSDHLKNFYWPTEEQERVLSVPLNSQALAALAKMGGSVILIATSVFCTLRSEGDAGTTAIQVPRIAGRQICLFDDMDNVQPATPADLSERGQFVISPKLLAGMAKAAKLLNLPPRDMNIALIGSHYGISFGSDEDFWIHCPADVTVPAVNAGLPPYWLTGGSVAVTDALDAAAEHTEEMEAEYAEQGTLEYNDEHAPSEIDPEDIDEEGEGDFDDLADAPELPTENTFDLSVLPADAD